MLVCVIRQGAFAIGRGVGDLGRCLCDLGGCLCDLGVSGGNFHLKVGGGGKSSGNADDPMLGVAVIP